jgi:copper chaperone CopZ
MRCRSLLILLVLVSSASPVAAAERPSAASREQAAAHFQLGIAFYKSGDYPAALAEFNAAYKAAPSWAVLFNIGIAERRLYRYGDAVRTLNRYLEEGGKAVPKARRDEVKRELSEVRALVAEVTVTVEGASAEVRVDGAVVGKSPLAEPLLLGPGRHVLRAERGADAAEETLELVSGTQVPVALSPKPKPAAPARLAIDSTPPKALVSVDGARVGVAPVTSEVPAGGHLVTAELAGYEPGRIEVVLAPGQERVLQVSLRPERVKRERKLFVPGLVLAGGGVALLGTALYFGLSAQASAKQVSDLFVTGGAWDEQHQRVQAAGQTQAKWSLGLTIGGGAALVAGGVLTAVLSTWASDDGGQVSFAPLPSGGALVAWGASW